MPAAAVRWGRLSWLLGTFLLAGCAADRAQRDLDQLFVEMTPLQYARILCQVEPMVERHTCMTLAVQHYRATRILDEPPADVSDGPFVVIMENRRYPGRYVSNPFAAAFTVSDDARICRGRYSAFAGDPKPVFDVFCNDGREGRAQIVLDQTGRNGIGRLWMENGESGDILFGDAAVPEPFR